MKVVRIHLACALAASLAACGAVPPLPVLLPQEKLVLTPVADSIRRDDLEVRVGGQLVAHSPTYQNLAEYTRCVPRASAEAAKGTRYGRAGRWMSGIGATLFWSSLAAGAFGNAFAYLSGPGCGNEFGCTATIFGLTTGMLAGVTLGKVFEFLGSDYQRTAHVRAQNAVRIYNDAVGTLDARCEDRRETP
jgi:hypothetical protein